MPAFRSIRTRKRKKKLNNGFELQLTSLIDVLVIILVFLLKSYQTSLNTLTTVQGIQMPISASPDELPKASLSKASASSSSSRTVRRPERRKASTSSTKRDSTKVGAGSSACIILSSPPAKNRSS
jgi:biopolymer transport protein ExbD